MSIANITPLSQATTAENRRRHARSRMAGRLFSIFDQLHSIARECRENGEDLRDPVLTRLGGRSPIAADSPLLEAMRIACHESVILMEAAEPDRIPDRYPPKERP